MDSCEELIMQLVHMPNFSDKLLHFSHLYPVFNEFVLTSSETILFLRQPLHCAFAGTL